MVTVGAKRSLVSALERVARAQRADRRERLGLCVSSWPGGVGALWDEAEGVLLGALRALEPKLPGLKSEVDRALGVSEPDRVVELVNVAGALLGLPGVSDPAFGGDWGPFERGLEVVEQDLRREAVHATESAGGAEAAPAPAPSPPADDRLVVAPLFRSASWRGHQWNFTDKAAHAVEYLTKLMRQNISASLVQIAIEIGSNADRFKLSDVFRDGNEAAVDGVLTVGKEGSESLIVRTARGQYMLNPAIGKVFEVDTHGELREIRQ